MLKVALAGVIGLVAGILVAVVLIKPAIQNRVNTLAEKARPTMTDFKNSRLKSMAAAKDDKSILKQLIKSGDDQLTLLGPAKSKSRHPELTKYAQDSAYTAAYNRELARILMEDLGYAPSHGAGPHCDSVGC